jgi:hypothetical protein
MFEINVPVEDNKLRRLAMQAKAKQSTVNEVCVFQAV